MLIWDNGEKKSALFLISITVSNWILPFCIGKIVKSICKYLGWLLKFGRNSFHFARYLWAMIIYAPNTSLEGNDVGGVWNQDAKHLLWAIICTSSVTHTSTLWMDYHCISQVRDTECWRAPRLAHCYQWWHWDLIQGLYGPEFMLQAFNHLPKVRRTFPI